ncbi:helix-turn-helix domain-containing protein [Streptomyces purpureus]|uniref:helix-turn-helix domain-containing protein n=1 Tax=Streptomyces purpureus TaxID=1951 RepID=UPI0037A987F9
MTVAQFSARTPARGGSSVAGVTHVRHRHDEKFTVVGNHLAQHRQLSACAIGIGVYIQSLPDGALIGVKVLTARFPEGEARISKALRELEAAGYLERKVERLGGARIVTRTRWYEHPHAADQVKVPAALPVERPAKTRTEPKPRVLPELTEELKPAAALLARLRQLDPRLLLSETDVRRLAPGVQRWLERGVAPAAAARTLAGELPAGTIRWPRRLLEHRLREWLPPELPPEPEGPKQTPMQTCEGCDRAFRSDEPGRCRDCKGDVH